MDAFTIAWQLAVIALLVALNGFFVAAEFTIVKVRPSQLEELIADGNRQARYAKTLVDHMDVSLSVTQLGITLVSLGLGWVGEPYLAAMLRPGLAAIGVTGGAVDTIAFAVAFSLITAAHIILGELAPKNISIVKPLPVLLGISLPLLLFQRLTYPFVWLLNTIANHTVRFFGYEPEAETTDAHSEDEIRILMAESRKQGFIGKTEYDFVDNVFDFSDKEARDIMTPRTDMVCLFLENGTEKNIQIALEQRQTRYPLCREDKDNIVGFLHIKDLLSPLCQGRQPDLRQLARRVLVVPETMAVSRLLKTMQQKRSQLAIVVDEYGGTAGMATIEDVVEEIVGDIQDEFDQERPAVERRGPRVFSIDGRLLIEEVNDILETHLEADHIDTIGGWLYAQVETPPRVGQGASVGGNAFFVEETERLRITRVLVKLGHDLQEEHDEIQPSNETEGTVTK
ncbi:MAG: HlyC/CorC family transporter [Schwartzia sp.]|nr:HlyC/CorC family transporter [Schwartzia sp. (in: firmicutes)]